MSFHKFLSQNSNLTPDFVPGVTELSVDEVAKHKSPSDMWTIYRGNVYNIGPFLDYHPGGEEELMKAAGVDCTALYDKYHPWVNIDAVMGHLKLGPLKQEIPSRAPSKAKSQVGTAQISPLKENGVGRVPSRTSSQKPESPIRKAPLSIDTQLNPAREGRRRIRSFDILDPQVGIFRLFSAVAKENLL